METTTKNLIAIDFLSKDHFNGSFKGFSEQQIKEAKDIVCNKFLLKNPTNNDIEILGHWHKSMLRTLKNRTLRHLIN